MLLDPGPTVQAVRRPDHRASRSAARGESPMTGLQRFSCPKGTAEGRWRSMPPRSAVVHSARTSGGRNYPPASSSGGAAHVPAVQVALQHSTSWAHFPPGAVHAQSLVPASSTPLQQSLPEGADGLNQPGAMQQVPAAPHTAWPLPRQQLQSDPQPVPPGHVFRLQPHWPDRQVMSSAHVPQLAPQRLVPQFEVPQVQTSGIFMTSDAIAPSSTGLGPSILGPSFLASVVVVPSVLLASETLASDAVVPSAFVLASDATFASFLWASLAAASARRPLSILGFASGCPDFPASWRSVASAPPASGAEPSAEKSGAGSAGTQAAQASHRIVAAVALRFTASRIPRPDRRDSPKRVRPPHVRSAPPLRAHRREDRAGTPRAQWRWSRRPRAFEPPSRRS